MSCDIICLYGCGTAMYSQLYSELKELHSETANNKQYHNYMQERATSEL